MPFEVFPTSLLSLLFKKEIINPQIGVYLLPTFWLFKHMYEFSRSLPLCEWPMDLLQCPSVWVTWVSQKLLIFCRGKSSSLYLYFTLTWPFMALVSFIRIWNQTVKFWKNKQKTPIENLIESASNGKIKGAFHFKMLSLLLNEHTLLNMT